MLNGKQGWLGILKTFLKKQRAPIFLTVMSDRKWFPQHETEVGQCRYTGSDSVMNRPKLPFLIGSHGTWNFHIKYLLH